MQHLLQFVVVPLEIGGLPETASLQFEPLLDPLRRVERGKRHGVGNLQPSRVVVVRDRYETLPLAPGDVLVHQHQANGLKPGMESHRKLHGARLRPVLRVQQFGDERVVAEDDLANEEQEDVGRPELLVEPGAVTPQLLHGQIAEQVGAGARANRLQQQLALAIDRAATYTPAGDVVHHPV